MAKQKRQEPKAWTASQVVAHNLTKARELRGFTQTEVAERLTKFTDSRWSQATVAQAEGSVSGQRVRQFTANELVALARTFDLPVFYFFMPPEDGDLGFETPDSPARGWPWEYLLLLVWGHERNYPILSDRAAAWAHASTVITVPRDDLLENTPTLHMLEEFERHRHHFHPDDMLAVAFYGLARRKMRGSMRPGEQVKDLAENLRGLADALEAFNNYRPGTFFADEVRESRRKRDEEQS